MRKLLHDYLVLVAQLETQFLTNPGFTLHVLNTHVLPASHLMLQIHTLVHDICLRNALLRDGDPEDDFGNVDNILTSLREGREIGHSRICIGGGILALVTQRLDSMAGDPIARSLLTSFLKDSSRPYMMMLNE
jgi:gamma-tubulin complex component 2